jgi:hypothetical protein
MKKIPPEIAKNFVLTSFSALSILAVAPAQAVILDFQSLEQNNNDFNYVASPYTEDGFKIVDLTYNTGFYSIGTQTQNYAGSTALTTDYFGSVTRLTQVGGGTFTLSSIGLGNTIIGGDLTISFTGLKADNTTVIQDFTTDLNAINLRTFDFSNFTDLVSVDWVEVNSFANYYQFDNINVSPTVSAAVPEPFSILGTIFGAGSGVALKRKLSKDRQAKNQIA